MKLPWVLFAFTLAMVAVVIIAFFIEESPRYTAKTESDAVVPSSYEVEFTVTDDGTPPRGDVAYLSLSWGEANRPPILDSLPNIVAHSGETVAFTVPAANAGSREVRYYVRGLPEGASFDAETRNFAWTVPSDAENISERVVFLAADDGLPVLTDSEAVAIVGPAGNGAPEFNFETSLHVAEGEHVELKIAAGDEDGGALTYRANGLPAGAAFDAETQTFTWDAPVSDGSKVVYMGHGYAHPNFATMQVGGSSQERHESVLVLGWAFAVLQVGFFVTCLNMGLRKKERAGPALAPLAAGGAVFAIIFTLLVYAYRTFMVEGPQGRFLTLPIPTAWMLYGVWFFPVFFIVFFVVTFDKWNLSHEEVAEFREMVAAERAKK